MNKIWHKPLHKRKVWKLMSLYEKTVYYLQPFVSNLIDIWLQPLPFPTLLKIACSCFLILLMLVPFIIPIVIIIIYFAIFQCLIESALGIVYPKNLDIVHNVFAIFDSEIENEKYIEYLYLHLETWRYVASFFVSCIDYMRLALAVMTN